MSKCVRESSKSLGALTLPPEQPREFALPEGRSYNADPTPFRRVRGGLPRATRQPGPVPPPSMSTVPSQTSAGGARFLHAHHRRFHFRRMDPRAPLSVRVLPAYRIVAAGLRLAVLALQRHRRRATPQPEIGIVGLARSVHAAAHDGARALTMLNAAGWIPAHRFLFSGLRQHLLGWSRSLIPGGRHAAIPPAAAPA